MRKWYVALALVLGGLAWFANASPKAQAQFRTAGLTEGEQVRIYVGDADTSVPIQCVVIDVHDGFLGCAAKRDGAGIVNRSAVESWHNLRFVTLIQRPAKQ